MSNKDVSIPGWAISVATIVVAIIVAVVSTIHWLDGHYATKHELELVQRELQAVNEMKSQLTQVREEIVNLRIVLAQTVPGMTVGVTGPGTP